MASLFTPLLAASALILSSCGVGDQAPQPDTSNQQPQTRSSERQQTFSKAELEELVTPIALYSDPLLARVLMASSNPLELVEASRWVKQNKHLKGSELLAAAEKQRWVYSVKQLTATPSVLIMMSDKLDWTRKLQHAVIVQEPDVLDAVLRVRAVAQAAQDTLNPTDEQKVARLTEDNKDVGIVAQAPQPDISNPPPQTESGEGQEQRVRAVAQAQDTFNPPDEQKVARLTEDNKDVGTVAQGSQPDISNPPPQTESGQGQEQRVRAVAQAAQDTLNPPDEQKVARLTEADRNRGSRASRTISRNNEGVTDRDQRDYRANVHNRGSSDRKAATRQPASNKQVKSADRSKKRLVQDRAPRRSDLRAASERQTRMQADRDRASQMRMTADLDRRSFAADRSIEHAMILGFFGGAVERGMRGFGRRRR